MNLIYFTFSIEKITTCIENITNDDMSDPLSTYNCTDKPIFSLAFHRDFLIAGSSNGLVTGYVVSNGIIQKTSWSIQLPLNHEQYEIGEVNDLWVDQANDLIYAACGNWIYQCSLDDGKVVKEFKGHKDYIHSVRGYGDNIVSASEDGSVKLWDQRENKAPTVSLEPYKCPTVNRKDFGKWIGSASISKDWLACGGATKLALYNLNHLSSKQPFQVFDSFPKEIHVTDFIDSDRLLVAGECNLIIQYSLKGDMISEIETTSGPAVYSVAWQKKNQRNILAAAGASNHIDITTNFTYKEATLNFYKNEKN